MKTTIIISAVFIIGLTAALSFTVTKKNKLIKDLQYELSEKEDEIEELKSEKDELTTKVTNLEAENTSLQKRSESVSNFQSRANLSYPLGTYPTPNMSGATVVYKRSGCDYFILESMQGYIVAEWMGGHDPGEGETLYGKFDTYGTKSYFNGTNTESRLWIEDFWLSKEDAFEKLNDECN